MNNFWKILYLVGIITALISAIINNSVLLMIAFCYLIIIAIIENAKN